MKFSGIHNIPVFLVKILVCLFFQALGFQAPAQEDTSYSQFSLDSVVEAANEEVERQIDFNQHSFTDTALLRSVPDSVVKNLQAQKEFRYANDPSYWTIKERNDGSGFFNALLSVTASPAFRVILYILLALLVIYVVYQVVVANNLFIFARSAKRKKQQDKDEESLLSDDLDEQIRIALGNNDRRLAIRYLFLKTLRLLNDKNLIRLHARSTNYDYIKQMRQFAGADEFSFLTRVYEYVWYGEFQPSSDQFAIISDNFNQFINKH